MNTSHPMPRATPTATRTSKTSDSPSVWDEDATKPRTPSKKPSHFKRYATLALLFVMFTGPFLAGAFGDRRWGVRLPTPGFVTIERVVSTLSDNSRLQLKVAIETPDAKSAVLIGGYANQLRSMMFLTPAGFSAKQLGSTQGKLALADTLREVFRKNVDPGREKFIVAVHFQEFLMADE